ncbi:MAG TPA: GDP-L-fucose synthase [Bacteroidota bacterium]|nr:GDP-L-fucose synthase [Bacteroidota bacterium]
MVKSSKIFVAGHHGLVGSAVYRTLHDHGYANLITADHAVLDLRRQSDVEQFFREQKPEFLFLCAATVGGILANTTRKAEFIYDNLAIAVSVIHSAYRAGVKKLLNLGSSCIYPRLAPQPMKEEYLLTGSLELTNEAYAIAKIAAIKLCRYYNEQYGTEFISLMPTNLYGVHDNYNLESSHVLAALLRKFILAKFLQEKAYDRLWTDIQRASLGFGIEVHQERPDPSALAAMLERVGVTAGAVTIWGSGKPYREFLHADDLAEAAVYLMERYSHAEIGELINVGTGKDQTIADLATLIKTTVGYRGEIRYDTSRPDGTPRKLLDVSRISSLGWKAKISLEEGLRRAAESYLTQGPAS